MTFRYVENEGIKCYPPMQKKKKEKEEENHSQKQPT